MPVLAARAKAVEKQLSGVPALLKSQKSENYEKAIDICLGILDTDEYNVAALYYGGIAAMQMFDSNTATSLICRGLEIAPNHAPMHDVLATTYANKGDWDGAIAHNRIAMKIAPDAARHSGMIFAYGHRAGITNAQMREVMAEYGRAWGGGPYPEWQNELTTTRRLNIGYVSGDFRHHSASSIFAPVIFKHDRDRFQVTLYSQAAPEFKGDKVLESYQKTADRWRDVEAMDDDAFCAQVLEDKIDILVDLSSHTSGSRLTAFAKKPAPIQVTAWGYAVGTGLREVDYMFGDAIATPKDWADQFLVEKVWNLPCIVAWNSPSSESGIPIGEAPYKKNGHLTFGFVGRHSKITRETTDQWAALLRAVPDSKLLIKTPMFADPAAREPFMNALIANGIESERITLHLYATDRANHLNFYNEFDVALDSTPHGGGVSVLEACWMGVPSLILKGDRVQSRISTSVMNACGEGNWSRLTLGDYTTWGRIVAANPDAYLLPTRNRLRQSLEDSIICNHAGYTAEVEAAYTSMWRQWVASRLSTPVREKVLA